MRLTSSNGKVYKHDVSEEERSNQSSSGRCSIPHRHRIKTPDPFSCSLGLVLISGWSAPHSERGWRPSPTSYINVLVFGSQATGRSDIDLDDLGYPIASKVLAAIREAFDELQILQRVDVVDFSSADETFKSVALQRIKSLYERQAAEPAASLWGRRPHIWKLHWPSRSMNLPVILPFSGLRVPSNCLGRV